jgi:hypothetical protein
MSKKFIAQVNNIIFRGKRYDKGDEVLVDNSVQMNAARWLDFETHQKNLEVSVKETSDLTDSESKKKIADLTKKLAESEKKIKELEKSKEIKKDSEKTKPATKKTETKQSEIVEENKTEETDPEVK